MTEQELLVDCLPRLNGVSAAYMLTGSMASNFWGIPRTTHDLDFVIPTASIQHRWASIRFLRFLPAAAVGCRIRVQPSLSIQRD